MSVETRKLIERVKEEFPYISDKDLELHCFGIVNGWAMHKNLNLSEGKPVPTLEEYTETIIPHLKEVVASIEKENQGDPS